MNLIKNTIGIVLMFLIVPFSLMGQVSVAPTSIFSDQNGIAVLYVTNSSPSPQEVSISFLFGYPGNDSIGNLEMVYIDSLREKQSGLGERIRTFPRSFVLGPNQQQTVRFQIRPDKTKPDGTFFTRVKVTSNSQTQDIESVSTEEISTQVNFKFDQVLAVFHKSGNVSTGLELTKLEGIRKGNTLLLNTDFIVLGNSPYLGSIQADVKDSSGKIVATFQQTVALYFEGKRNYTISLPEGLAPGSYQVSLLFKTERADIPSTDLVQAAPVNKTFTVEL